MFKKLFSIVALACVALSPAMAQQGAQGGQKQPEVQGPKDPNIREVVSSKESMVQVSKDKDKWFFVMPDSLLGRLMQTVTRFTQTPAGLDTYAGEELREQTVYFVLSPDGKNIHLKSSILFCALDTLDNLGRGARLSNTDPIIMSFALQPGAPAGHYKIDVTPLLMGENCFGLPQNARRVLGLAGMMGGGASYVESVHAYPINIEVRTVRTYATTGPTLPAASVSGNITLGLNTSFVLLPKEPMRGRIFDPRVGYFNTGHYKMRDAQQEVETEIFVARYRLEPKNEEDAERQKRGELIEPKKQIVYYIDPATPKQWVPYLIAGVNDWNAAFEQAGWKNAIAGKEWPDSCKDMSLEDARFCVIRYLPTTIANAYGPHVSDPRSGEIIESHVGWYHNVMTLVHDWYFVQCANVDERARTAKYDEDLMGELIRFVSSHEIGHTLGLRHNFGASSCTPVEKLRDKAWVAEHGHTTSIMDYARFNYVAQPGDGLTESELFPRINDYDKWAIEWAYKPVWDATDSESERHILSLETTKRIRENHRLWWGDGEGVRVDPRRQTEDLGDDAVKASEYGMNNLKAILPHLQEWTYWGSDTHDQRLYTMYNQVTGQMARYFGHVMRYLQGSYITPLAPYEEGDVYAEVPRDKKVGVLPFFDKYIFQEPMWLTDVPYISRLTSDAQILRTNMGQRYVSSLSSASTLRGLTPNYPISEYLPALEGYLFKSTKANKPLTVYERALQSTYIKSLCNQFGSIKTNPSGDYAGYIFNALNTLQKKMKSAASATNDALTKTHYTQMADLIERTMSHLNAGSGGGGGGGLVITFGLTDYDETNVPEGVMLFNADDSGWKCGWQHCK